MSRSRPTTAEPTQRDWRYWVKLCGFTVVCALIGLLIGSAYLGYRGAQHYIYPPRAALPLDETPARFGSDYEDIHLFTQDGITLSAWYTPAQNGAVILIAHGYGAARSAALHARFAQQGYGVISWDARAHGASGGERSTMGYEEALDVAAALDYALQQEGVQQVGAFGNSMGAATVIRAAAQRHEIAAVVADSAYPTLEEMIARVAPYPVLRPFFRFFAEREVGISVRAMRPLDEIGQLTPRPVFIIQGAADATVPPDSAQRLYAAAGEPRTLWLGPGVGHGGMRAADPDEYDQRVFTFFDTYLLMESSCASGTPPRIKM